MNVRSLRVSPVILATAVAACLPADRADAPGEAAATVADSVAEAELDSIYDVFTRAYRRADTDLLMDSVYATDGFYLPPDAPILEGQEEFRGQFSSFLDPRAARDGPGPDISFEIRDRAISGDLAYDIGVYTIRPPEAGPDDPGNRGKFIVIWKRGPGGEWRIHADGFSAIR